MPIPGGRLRAAVVPVLSLPPRRVARLFRVILKAIDPLSNPAHRPFLLQLIDSDVLPLSGLRVFQVNTEIRGLVREGYLRSAAAAAFREGSSEDLDALLKLMPNLLRASNTAKEIDSYWNEGKGKAKSPVEAVLLVLKLINARASEGHALAVRAALDVIAETVAKECGSMLLENGHLRAVDFLKAYNRVRSRLQSSPEMSKLDQFFDSLGGGVRSSSLPANITFLEVMRRVVDLKVPGVEPKFSVEGVALPKMFLSRINFGSRVAPASALISSVSAASDAPKSINLSALVSTTWLANYSQSSGLQELRLRYDEVEGFLEAVKIDSDQFVPKDKVTWRLEHADPGQPLQLDTPMKGQVQVAHEGFTDPVFQPASFMLTMSQSPSSRRKQSGLSEAAVQAEADSRRVLEIHIKSPPSSPSSSMEQTPAPTVDSLSLRCVPVSDRDLGNVLIGFGASGLAGPVPPSRVLEIMRRVFGPSTPLQTLERAGMRVATDRAIIARICADISTYFLTSASSNRGGGGGRVSKASVNESFYWLAVRKTFESVYRRRNTRK